jgi:hypothetical protein
MSWINPISARIFKTLWGRLGDMLPQVPRIIGTPKRFSNEGPRRIPINN